MISIDAAALAESFIRYAQVDTQSDPDSTSYPSTEKQKDLGLILFDELRHILDDVTFDEYGYVYAVIPSNTSKKVPAITFCSHVDTAPDSSGTNVKPILHTNFNGDDIILPDDPAQVLRVKDSPYLKEHIGKDIITASGLTLLGADDKSGLAIIMSAVRYLVAHPEIKHGQIRIVFTPDEEVGRGTAKINMERLGEFGYTLDGGEAGSLEDETFSADGATIIIHGISAHPGYAKDKMINAIKIAGEIAATLPRSEWSPESTEKKEGFVHPVNVSGIAEKASIQFIVRDFDTTKLESHHERLKKHAAGIVKNFPGAQMEYRIQEQYRNMKQVLDKVPQVVDYAREAIKRTGLTVKMESIRGGTDGSRLSYMGMPCPNIFTGMQNIHSKLEWVGVEDMVKAAETLVHLSMIWEEKA